MENKDFLHDLLENLRKPIPAHWRVQSFSKKKPVATVMAYIEARDAMDTLDAYAVYGWHREHYVVDSKVYCKVGIVMPDNTIMWRSDCGVESNTDGEKGQSSDSFKRACVNFGIGRFLYDLPVQYVTASEVKTASNYPHCIDENGKQIWDLNTYINNKLSNGKAPAKPEAQKDSRPDMTEAQYKKAMARITNGEPGVYASCDKAFKINDIFRANMIDAEKGVAV